MATKKDKKDNKKRLILLDSHAILHRAYHALPDFTSSRGEPTGALYGLSTMLLKTIKDLKPDYIIAAFDLPKPTYRHEVYEDYKAGRVKTDDSLVAQIERSRDVFEAFSIPVYEKEGFEADDVLGTIVEKVKGNKSLEVIIASGDMDTLQLVDNKKVQVYTLRKGIKDTVMYDEDAVKERFGFGPDLLPDYKGLRGDPSDNIVGIKGIGEKTATQLITKFGKLEDMYKKLSKDEKNFEDVGIKTRIINLLKEGEGDAIFSKTLATIRRDAPIKFQIPKREWNDEVNPEKILELFDDLTFRTLGGRIKELFNIEEDTTRQLSLNEAVGEQVSDREVEETAIGLWLLDSDMSNPNLDDILRYAKTKDFKKAQKQILDEIKKQKLLFVYEDIELPLIPVLKEMKERGVLIDTKFLGNLSKKYHKELALIQDKIWKLAGVEFNIKSPKQLGEVLYDKLGIGTSKIKKTATGARSTRESELQKLIDEHEIIPLILEFRELQKLLSTYIDAIPTQLGEDGRLHPTFLQTGTTTGRIASQNPNVQNIPIRTKLGRVIRNAFVAEKGYKIVALDYSQIELRIAAVISGDKKLIEVFKEGQDIHRAVAAEIFDVGPEDVDKGMRFKAKTINFGILYGMGVNALKKNIGTTLDEAKVFYNKYFSEYEGLSGYINKTKKEVAKKGYTETFFGRRRYFEGINSHLPFVRAAAERMAVNAPIQGTQADIVKLAMIKINKYLEKEGLKDDVRMLLQVHDELVFEIKEKKVKDVVPKLKEIMEDIISKENTHGITFIADTQVGDNWGELKEI